MKINSLEQMETIVDNNKSLEWSGWDVVEIRKSPTGWMKPEGVYRNDGWNVRKFYNLSYDGWEIPSKFVGNDAK